jgi:hypothetical protein
VNLFSAPASTVFEEQVLDLHNLEAEEGRQGDLYASLMKEIRSIESECANLGLLRHRIAAECAQLEEEHELLTQTMFGPPRRDPAPHQIEANHARMIRINQLFERLKQIDARMKSLTDNKGVAGVQCIDVAKRVNR